MGPFTRYPTCASYYPAFYRAAERNDLAALEAMLACGFDPNRGDESIGKTALHVAAMEGWPEAVRLLLAHGGSVTVRDREFSAQPLIWAAEGSRTSRAGRDHAAVGRLLLDAGSPLEWQTGAEPAEAIVENRERLEGASPMKSQRILWSGLGAVGLFGAMGGAWILSLPPTPAHRPAPPISDQEADAILAALKPPKRQRPVIAIIGINDATETTDYLMPYGILRRANVAEIVLLATGPGPVQLYPALKVDPHATVAAFDARHPNGADYVIVPAMSRDDDQAALAWLRSQAAKGATIIGVCGGAKVVGEAGLLDGKRATTHWYYVKELRNRHPAVRYVTDRRLVVDRGVATTTGITASMPMSLTLIEAIAGRDKAEAVGRDLGLNSWDARHHSQAFQFTRPFALTAIGNTIALWNRERLGLELMPDVDEVSLARVARAAARHGSGPTRRSDRVALVRNARSRPGFDRPGSLPRCADNARIAPRGGMQTCCAGARAG